MNDFDWAGKSKQPACKNLRVWTKNEENFEKFQENFEIFWSKSLWKIEFFSQFFIKYFLDFRLRSEGLDIWKITPDFYNNFSDFRGGVNVPAPPPLPTPLLNRRNYISVCRITLLGWLAIGKFLFKHQK